MSVNKSKLYQLSKKAQEGAVFAQMHSLVGNMGVDADELVDTVHRVVNELAKIDVKYRELHLQDEATFDVNKLTIA